MNHSDNEHNQEYGRCDPEPVNEAFVKSLLSAFMPARVAKVLLLFLG